MFHVGEWIEEQYLVLEKQSDPFWVNYRVLDRISENVFEIRRFSDLIFADDLAAARFLEKAKAWINLGEYDEIVHAYLVKEYDRIPHLFLEYVNGPSLSDVLNSCAGKPLPLEQIVALMKQLIEGMKFLHGASSLAGSSNVIHGGLEPDAILLREGNAKLTNIGLVPVLREALLKISGHVMFSHSPYLAPEQLNDAARADELTDIYSFGSILYEAATGAAPTLPRKHIDDPLQAFVVATPVAPRLRNRACASWLEETILKCMAKDPKNRFQTFKQIDNFLEGVLKSQRTASRQIKPESEKDLVSRIARVRGLAKKESRRLNHYYLGVEHLMLALIQEEESLLVSCFGGTVAAADFQAELLSSLPKGEGPWYWEGIIKTPRYQRIMSHARKIRRHLGHPRMIPQHILLSILEEGRSIPVRVLKELKVDIKAAAEQLQRDLHRKTPAISRSDDETPLGRFTRKLVCSKTFSESFPLVGREEELQKAIDLISENKCVLFIGKAGIGRTALIHEMDCRLLKCSSATGRPYGGIYELNAASLISEMCNQEELATRLHDVFVAITKTHSLLFIRGIDLFFGLDTRTRAAFFVDILLDFIRNNQLLIMASTGPDGFASCEMEPGGDISLFKTIHLSELPEAEILKIIYATKDIFAKKYSIHIEDEALNKALDLSRKFPDLALPGEALDILDKACLLQTLRAEPGDQLHLDAAKVEQFHNLVRLASSARQ